MGARPGPPLGAGPGSFVRLGESKLLLPKIDVVLLTHLHVDYAGKRIIFTGDIDTEGLPDLRRIAAGTSLLVFNSVVLDPPSSPAIFYTLHTPPKLRTVVAPQRAIVVRFG